MNRYNMRQMNVLKYIFLISIIFYRCGKAQDLTQNEEEEPLIDYRAEMRSFVIDMSGYAKAHKPSFNIIPQNGIELITEKENAKGKVYTDYLNAIDGHGQENLFYGYTRNNARTPSNISDYLIEYLKIIQKTNNSIFVIDYCKSDSDIEESIELNLREGFVSYTAPKRDLTAIPEIPASQPRSSESIGSLADAKNFLFFVNYEDYDTKSDVVDAISRTEYDIVFMDLFFSDGSVFGRSLIEDLKIKPNGDRRMVICYMSIGEAEDYRYYWNNLWFNQKPSWLQEENPNWPGNYKVKYWEKEWQDIIYGTENSYLDIILGLNFDGVYLDIIDGFEYFENK